MTPRRRLLVAAVLGTLAVSGLTGCRSEPGVAAYVGSTQITEDQVTEIADGVQDLIRPDQFGDLRKTIVQQMVLREVITRHARAEGITIPAPDVAAVTRGTELPPDAAFARLRAELAAALPAVLDKAAPANPTETDQREAYTNAGAGDQPFDAVRQFFTAEVMGPAVGQRDLLNKLVADADVTVNPRYGALTFQVPVQIGQVQTFLAVPVGRDQSGGVVRDAG